MDQFISKNKLKWVPYNKFENIKYFDKGRFGTSIYEATYRNCKVVFKYFKYFNYFDNLDNLDERLNEILNKV
jgi:hypothetical protein